MPPNFQPALSLFGMTSTGIWTRQSERLSGQPRWHENDIRRLTMDTRARNQGRSRLLLLASTTPGGPPIDLLRCPVPFACGSGKTSQFFFFAEQFYYTARGNCPYYTACGIRRYKCRPEVQTSSTAALERRQTIPVYRPCGDSAREFFGPSSKSARRAATPYL
jgi:hypothetical protein